MKPTHEIYVKVPVTAGSDAEAEKAAIIIANRFGGRLEKVDNLNELPF